MKDKTILITGGSGSLGQALTRQLLTLSPKLIKIYSRNESLQVQMRREFGDNGIRYILGDVRDRDQLWRALNLCDIVIHAAALKSVDIAEENPYEVISTNINGTTNVIDMCVRRNVGKAIFISSDKAVHPINFYGASKLLGEKLFLHANIHAKTIFSCVRLGNFTGSRSSVIPLWLGQIDKGEPLTITEIEMTRFWMTLEYAASFITDCIGRMDGNEIFLPKLTTKKVIELVGELAPNYPTKIIGKRAGEKLHEMLFAEGEKPEDCGDYYVIRGKI